VDDAEVEAIEKLKEVFEYSLQFFEPQKHYDHREYFDCLSNIALHFRGIVQDTGGHVLVAYVAAPDPHYIIGITDECAVLSYTEAVNIDYLYDRVWDDSTEERWMYSFLPEKDGKLSKVCQKVT